MGEWSKEAAAFLDKRVDTYADWMAESTVGEGEGSAKESSDDESVWGYTTGKQSEEGGGGNGLGSSGGGGGGKP